MPFLPSLPLFSAAPLFRTVDPIDTLSPEYLPDSLALLQAGPLRDPRDRLLASHYGMYVADLLLLSGETGLETLLFVIEITAVYVDIARGTIDENGFHVDLWHWLTRKKTEAPAAADPEWED